MAKHELDQLIVTNPTDQPFTVKWGGRDYTLQPGERKILMRFLAEHFAKHLANAVLMGLEKKHKDDYIAGGGSERDYIPKSYMNNRVLRPQTIDSILVGVYAYHQGDTQDANSMIQAQIDQLNPQQPKERELDLGSAVDPLYGVMKDDPSIKAPQAPAPAMAVPQPQPAPSFAGTPTQPPSGELATFPQQPQAGAEMMPTATLAPQPTPPPIAPPAQPDGGEDERSMKDLRAEAAKLDITIPVGMTKEAAKDLIRKQYA